MHQSLINTFGILNIQYIIDTLKRSSSSFPHISSASLVPGPYREESTNAFCPQVRSNTTWGLRFTGAGFRPTGAQAWLSRDNQSRIEKKPRIGSSQGWVLFLILLGQIIYLSSGQLKWRSFKFLHFLCSFHILSNRNRMPYCSFPPPHSLSTHAQMHTHTRTHTQVLHIERVFPTYFNGQWASTCKKFCDL